MNLNKIIDLNKWQALQDAIAMASKMAIITVDFRGVPVTEHSALQPFCHEIRKNSKLFAYCQKCDSRGGLEAVRQNAPYIYHCHCKIVDIAIPITVDGRYLGAIMIGQVKLSSEEDASLEQILAITDKNFLKTMDTLKDKYDLLPTLTFSQIKTIAEMVFQLSNYIIEEALNKNMAIEMYQQTLNQQTPAIPSGYTAQNIENTRKAIANTLLDKRLQSLAGNIPSCSNPVLKPIFLYIDEHRGESLPLKKAAELCHISQSHFSRIFTKETGEHYSNFITHLKITWSKHLLVDTNLSISQIGEELGFSETGYFIKTFKKYENVTPSIYRKCAKGL